MLKPREKEFRIIIIPLLNFNAKGGKYSTPRQVISAEKWEL